MQKPSKSFEFSIIPKTLLSKISGGKNEPPQTPAESILVGEGDSDFATGSVKVPVAVGTTIVTPFVTGNTVTGVNGGGLAIQMPFF